MSFFAPNPRLHDVSHEDVGRDEIDVTGLSGLLADGQTPGVHAVAHQNGGGDEISVAGLSGVLADPQPGSSYARLQDERGAGTQGGTFTQGAWQVRQLNVESDDPDGIVSIFGDVFTLQPGTYRVCISCPAHKVNGHKARLYNVTDAAVELEGSNAFTATNYYVENCSFIRGIVTIVAQKGFQVEHRCNLTRADDGFGEKVNLGTEIYTVVEIWKLS